MDLPSQANENLPDRDVQSVEKHLLEYLLDFEELRTVAKEVRMFIESSLNEQAIKFHLVEARAKSFDSYRKKSAKRLANGSHKYRRLPSDIDDCVAARVIVYTHEEQERAVNELRSRFEIRTGEDRNPAHERLDNLAPGWGYNSHHLVVQGVVDSLSEATSLGRYLEEGRRFEVQVRTVAAHAWAEYEHDVRYKPERWGSLPAKSQGLVDGLFKAAAEARISMDERFSEIEKLLNNGAESKFDLQYVQSSSHVVLDATPIHQGADKLLTVEELAQQLGDLYPESKQSTDVAISWMLTVLNAVDITTSGKLTEALATVDSARVSELLEYTGPTTRLRRLDDDLLASMGDFYVERTQGIADSPEQQHRRERYLPARLARLTGKLRIYEVRDVAANLGTVATAAGAVRLLVQKLVSQNPSDEFEIPGFVSSSEQSFAIGDRPTLWKFEPEVQLWIHGNLSRPLAEMAMKSIYKSLTPGTVEVYRSGDLILPAGNEVTRIWP